MKNQLTADQVQTISAYERYFTQATRAAWCSYPGQAAIHKMLDIWAELTGSPYPYKPGCPNCLLNLVRDMGHIYFAYKEAEAAAKVVSLPVESETPAKPKKATPAKKKAATAKKKAK